MSSPKRLGPCSFCCSGSGVGFSEVIEDSTCGVLIIDIAEGWFHVFDLSTTLGSHWPMIDCRPARTARLIGRMRRFFCSNCNPGSCEILKPINSGPNEHLIAHNPGTPEDCCSGSTLPFVDPNSWSNQHFLLGPETLKRAWPVGVLILMCFQTQVLTQPGGPPDDAVFR